MSDNKEMTELLAATAAISTELSESKASGEKMNVKVADLEKELVEMKAALENAAPKHEEKRDMNVKDASIKLAHAAVNMSGDKLNLKDLSVEGADSGDTLVLPVYANSVIESLNEVSVIRQNSRVLSSSTAAMQFPRKSASAQVSGWVGEDHLVDRNITSSSVFEMASTQYGTVYAKPSISREFLAVNSYSAMNIVRADIVNEINQKEEDAFLNGAAGSSMPRGILTSTNVEAITGDLIRADVEKLDVALTSGYKANAKFYMSPQAISTLRQLADGTDPVISFTEAGLTLMGKQVVSVASMPAGTTAGEIACMYGDLSRAFYIVDGFQIAMESRVPSSNPQDIEFYMSQQVGSLIADTSAMKFLKIA